MSNLRQGITVDYFNSGGRDYLPGHLEIEMLSITPNMATSRMAVKKLHLAPTDFLHAASIVALADSTCGCATLAHLPAGARSFTTIELKSNHLGTVLGGSIACAVNAQHLGRNTQVWDAIVTEEKTGRKIALFRCTQMILWPPSQAPGAR